MQKEDFEVFVLTDEDNVDHHFVLLAEIEDSGKKILGVRGNNG